MGYVLSLCTLMQHFGHGVQSRHHQAIAIYIVELQHIDNTCESIVAGEQKWKRLQLESEGGSKRVRQCARNDRLKCTKQGERSAHDINEINGDQRVVTVADSNDAPPAPHICKDPKLLPFPSCSSLTNDNYEVEVMALFINAKARGFCRRIICDRYFGNHLAGQSFKSFPQSRQLTRFCRLF